MSELIFQRIDLQIKRLRGNRVWAMAPKIVQRLEKTKLVYLGLIYQVLSEEIVLKKNRRLKTELKIAGLHLLRPNEKKGGVGGLKKDLICILAD